MADTNHDPMPNGFTEREKEILALLANGHSDREIAEALFLTVGTVKWYNRQIYSKLGVKNRLQAVTQAEKLGLLDADTDEADAEVAARPPHQLPSQITSFIGRKRELQDLSTLLPGSRLITLTGPPGSGKTRLAIEIARQHLTTYQDGVFFISLASLQQSGLLLNLIAQTVDVKESAQSSLMGALHDSLRDKHLLLILDNFEHLMPAAPVISDLLVGTSKLTILVTSRELLRLYGEREYPIPPLALPDLKVSAAQINHQIELTDAVRLFEQRAQAASIDFSLNDENIAAVNTICVHLDGLPLAIELAAARIRFYTPQALLLRLGSRLEALQDGPRDLPERQQTLRATLAWSYDLLDPDEQALFARLGVFVGGFSIGAAEAVCQQTDAPGRSIQDGLESLHNKSLIEHHRHTEADRQYSLLETMREYALERLDALGEDAATKQRHASYFLEKIEQAADDFQGNELHWMAWVKVHHDNLRAALQWWIDTDETAQQALLFIKNMAVFWELKGLFDEARAWLAKAQKLTRAEVPTSIRADALYAVGQVLYLQSDYITTQQLYDEALLIYRQLHDERNVAMTLISLGEVATEVGDYELAPDLFHQAYEITRQMDDTLANARALAQLGYCYLREGDLAQAQSYLADGQTLYQHENDKVGIALVSAGLGEIAIRLGNLDEGRALVEDSLALRRELGHVWGIGVSLGSLAWIAMHQKDYQTAIRTLQESLQLRQDIGDIGGAAWCLEKLAEVAYEQGHHETATKIYGYADKLRKSIQSVVDPSDQAHYTKIMNDLKRSLGEARFADDWRVESVESIEKLVREFVELQSEQ